MSARVKLSTQDLWHRAAELLPEIGAEASRREAERILPHAEIRALADAGMLTWRVPVEHGGPGASVPEVIRFVVDLAAVDANIAQAVRPALGFVEGLANAPVKSRQEWYDRVLDGDVFGGAFGEIGAANGVIRARIRPDGDDYRLSGHKYYSTGSLYADWLTVTAADEDGTRYAITLPADREGLRRVDDWDGIGQRLTASGSTYLDDALVHADELLDRSPADGERSLVTPFQQLVLAAVEAGIARNALTDATRFAREKARPIKHAYAATTVEDPYVQHAVGEIAARTYVAEAGVLRAAQAIEAAHAEDAGHDERVTAAVEVAQAQFVAVESALKSAELLFDVGGGSTALRTHNFDRHWRNARTVANHNPRYYKAGIVGAFLLTGAEPPTSGLF